MILGIVCHRENKEDINIFTDDISPGGIRFTSNVRIERNEDVKVDIPIGHGQFKSVNGTVAWIRRGVIHAFEGGIKFEDIDEKTQKALSQFIERNAEKE